jgi:hypothetical protein
MKRPMIFRIVPALSLGSPAFTHEHAPTQDLRSLQGEISANEARATTFGERPKGSS